MVVRKRGCVLKILRLMILFIRINILKLNECSVKFVIKKVENKKEKGSIRKERT